MKIGKNLTIRIDAGGKYARHFDVCVATEGVTMSFGIHLYKPFHFDRRWKLFVITVLGLDFRINWGGQVAHEVAVSVLRYINRIYDNEGLEGFKKRKGEGGDT